MRIGVDFDNTIVNYDGVFHAAAMERGLIGADLPRHKNAVRDFLNGSGRKDEFTLLQGYVYGTRMSLAAPHAGVADFLAEASRAGHELFIVSHKTRRPLLGPAYDMHESARGFLRANGISGEKAIPDAHIFFEETKEQKVARIGSLDIDVFIDDLPEIFVMPGMPSRCRRILFAPAASGPSVDFETCRSWGEISSLLLRHGR